MLTLSHICARAGIAGQRFAALLPSNHRRRLVYLQQLLKQKTVFALFARQSTTTFSSAITQPRAWPRRARCGLSLFEALLVMLIAIPMTQQGVSC